jgi:hypothetical protein
MRISSIFRVLGALSSWALFLLSWWRVARPGTLHMGVVLLTATQLIIAASAILALSALWILHNLRLHGKRRRRAALYVAPRYTTDSLGRKLVFPDAIVLEQAPIISVRIRGDRKVYEAEVGEAIVSKPIPVREARAR